MLRAAALLALLACASAQSLSCYQPTDLTPTNGDSTSATWSQVAVSNSSLGTFRACYSTPVTGTFSVDGGTVTLTGRMGAGLPTSCNSANLQAIAQQQAAVFNNYYNSNGTSGSLNVGTLTCCETSLCNTGIGGVATYRNAGASTTANALLMTALVACTFLLTSKLVV